LIAIVLLIGIRIALPFIIVKYVNKTLNQEEGYSGSIADVDLHLYRGAYRIDSLRMNVVDNGIEEPFVDIPVIDLSVQWKSLFKGAIVGEVEVFDPTINFAFSETAGQQQTGETVDWVKIVKDLMPININRFAVFNGDINLINVEPKSQLNASLNDLDLSITNIRNVEAADGILPSDIRLRGTSSLGGTIAFDAQANLLKTFPDFDYDARAEKIDLTKLNPVADAMVGITVEKGTLDLYTEMKARDQTLDGYIKPLLHDVTIFNWKEEDRSFGEAIKELVAEGGQELLEDKKKVGELTATRVPLSGTVENLKTGVWSAIINFLINAYIDRFQGMIDNTVDWKSGFGDDSKKEKKNEEGEEEEGFFKKIFN
jgi:hypothetical protein